MSVDKTGLPYRYLAIALKHAGVDPFEVNFVVQPDANPTREFLNGSSALLFLTTTAAGAFKLQCCLITTPRSWLQAHPLAAKGAPRPLYRAADSLPPDRVEAARAATDKGLFGGP